jgi:hypothetical protein
MAEGLKITELRPEKTFYEAAQENALLPVAFYNKGNARVPVNSIKSYIDMAGASERIERERVNTNTQNRVISIEAAMDLEVMTDTEITSDSDSVAVTNFYQNLKTKEQTQSTATLPTANSSTAGIMDTAMFVAFEQYAIDIDEIKSILNGKQNTLNRTVGSSDNAVGTVSDTGGDISVPIQVTTTTAAATSDQLAAGTYSLRGVIQRLINNIAQLFSGKQDRVANAVHCVDSGNPSATLYWFLGKLKNVNNNDLLKIEYILGNENSDSSAANFLFGVSNLFRFSNKWSDARGTVLMGSNVTGGPRCKWCILMTSDNSIYAKIKEDHANYIQAKFFIDTHELENTNSRPTASTTSPSNLEFEYAISGLS